MKKRALTLLEIMIVIFLITLITGAIGYSLKGSMDKGRAFTTRQSQQQLHDLLLLALAEGRGTQEDIVKDPKKYLTQLDIAKDPDKLLVDGWKQEFVITARGKSDFNVRSETLKKYDARTNPHQAQADAIAEAKPNPDDAN
jgi:type II secretory pathway pseudopilin PulG